MDLNNNHYIRVFLKSEMSLRYGFAFFVGIILIYINMVLTNLVSLRQLWYVESLANGTSFVPLHDTLFVDWLESYNIEQYVTMTLRDMVDVCTYGWISVTILAWWSCSRRPLIPAKILAVQIIVIPCFAISQLLTIVPDSTPNCLVVYNISTSVDISWIFWSWPWRACGNMLWSSSLAQLVLFTQIAVQMIPPKRTRSRFFIWLLGECWTFMTMAFIFSARYQYSMDVFVTILVIKLLVTHPWVELLAGHCFINKGQYYARAPTLELSHQTI